MRHITMNRVIIPCGGDGSRWNEHLGIPKQLLQYDGHETVLARIIRLCGRPDVDKVYVTTNDPRISQAVTSVEVAPVSELSNPAPVDKIMSSEALWSTDCETVILFGDTYFTEPAIEIIIQHRANHVVFFGRLGSSEFTGKKGSEIYGVKFRPADVPSLKAHCEFVRWSARAGHLRKELALTKMIMASMVAADGLYPDQYNWDQGHYDTKYMVKVDDRTEDFDCPKDFENWKATA